MSPEAHPPASKSIWGATTDCRRFIDSPTLLTFLWYEMGTRPSTRHRMWVSSRWVQHPG